MVNINLLNWRSAQLTLQNRRLFLLMGIVMTLSMTLILLLSFIVNKALDQKKHELQNITTQLAATTAAIDAYEVIERQQKSLQDQIRAIDALRVNRELLVTVFNDIAAIIPLDIVLLSMHFNGNALMLAGTAAANHSITMLMEQLPTLAWVANAKLSDIRINKNQKINFELELKLHDRNV